MKYVDEYRSQKDAEELIRAVHRRATRRWTIMEVCGGQTHGLLRHGIDEALADVVELIHGPGCPVCVTPAEQIDCAIELAKRPDVVLATFGDMLRVPGSRRSLATARATGAQVRAVYSPLDALTLAEREPDLQIIFFAVGFETTAPATALAVQQAARRGLRNFSLLTAHVRVLPAMETILRSPDNRVQAFLAAGHVCTVTGQEAYEEPCRRHQVPIVVTGFEPTDLLQGILACVDQLESGRYEVESRYKRCAHREGNPRALRLIEDVFEPCNRPWRGFGMMPQGGLKLRDTWREFDATSRFPDTASVCEVDSRCRSGDVLSGRIRPTQCPAFGKECTPNSPLGAPMVSGEGACAAYFQFHPTIPNAAVDSPGGKT